MRLRFALSRVLVTLLVLAALAAAVYALAPRIFYPPLPPAPTIAAPAGALPAAPVAFQENVREVESTELVGAGFLLALPSGDVIGVTTAHSLAGRPDRPLLFTLPLEPGTTVATFLPPLRARGRPRTGDDLTVDYVLLDPQDPPAAAGVLQPDARGAPQPGERVWLYSGRDGRVLGATVESAGAQAVWVRLDAPENVGGMSGSPVLSAHTGQVVGMAVAVRMGVGVTWVGLNPISAILAVATR
jgi:hypothetical protein